MPALLSKRKIINNVFIWTPTSSLFFLRNAAKSQFFVENFYESNLFLKFGLLSHFRRSHEGKRTKHKTSSMYGRIPNIILISFRAFEGDYLENVKYSKFVHHAIRLWFYDYMYTPVIISAAKTRYVEIKMINKNKICRLARSELTS